MPDFYSFSSCCSQQTACNICDAFKGHGGGEMCPPESAPAGRGHGERLCPTLKLALLAGHQWQKCRHFCHHRAARGIPGTYAATVPLMRLAAGRPPPQLPCLAAVGPLPPSCAPTDLGGTTHPWPANCLLSLKPVC